MHNHHSHSSNIAVTLLSAVVVVFLTIYNKQVCPFMTKLFFMQLFKGLFIIMCFQTAIRMLLNYFFLKDNSRISYPAICYRISLATWFLTGIVAVIVHSLRYPDFPAGSHVKLISGYWALGCGILALLERAIFERDYRKSTTGIRSSAHNESMPVRILINNALFTAVPVFTLLMILTLYVHQGFVSQKVRTEAFYLGCFFVFVSSLTAWLYGKKLENDVRSIVKGINTVSQGDFTVNLDTTRPDELGMIAEGINSMSQGLLLRERIREAFGRFVSREVAEEFISNHALSGNDFSLGGKRRKLTVLYCDIRNFTPLSESMTPEELSTLLNDYFTEMVSAVSSCRGVVDKFIGDAVMAVFGLTGSENHASDAVKAALSMRKALENFNQKRKLQGDLPIDNGIGIHTGEMIAGYFGSRDRLEFTVIGNTVNMASRIESQSRKPNPPVLFSAEVAEDIKDDFDVFEAVETELKGISGKQKLYSCTIF